jgi:hypothetical protein
VAVEIRSAGTVRTRPGGMEETGACNRRIHFRLLVSPTFVPVLSLSFLFFHFHPVIFTLFPIFPLLFLLALSRPLSHLYQLVCLQITCEHHFYDILA